MKNTIKTNNKIKPFLKWAGGKTQMLSTFEKLYPQELFGNNIKTYIEPFVGAGAVFFDVIQKNKSIKNIVLCDINKHLINVWRCIQKRVVELIKYLKKFESEFYDCKSDEERGKYFIKIRNDYNSNKNLSNRNYLSAAQFIFLNKTCFNGLYRVSVNGDFNVPFAHPKNPLICDEENLINIHNLLIKKKIKILCASFEKTKNYIKPNTFVYFDPPYRPIKSDSFVNYAKKGFGDKDQIKLASFFKEISSQKSVYCMLSNSDPKNTNPNDNFFDDLYKEFDIQRVSAKRMINSKGEGRGNVFELVVRNYSNN